MFILKKSDIHLKTNEVMVVYKSKVQKCVNFKFKKFLVLLFREYIEAEGDDTRINK